MPKTINKNELQGDRPEGGIDSTTWDATTHNLF